jgi:DNA-binding IclR family transcriptional regulator
MDINKMRDTRAEADERVLNHLRGCLGSTAWAMSGAVRLSREEVSKACHRLKRKGLVATSPTQTTYWQAVSK